MELTIAAQEDSTPWDTPQATTTEGSKQRAASILPGRSYFSKLGVVRRKPSRPDAPPTLSKSCSDKLSLKQGTSLLSSITSLLIHPSNAYMDSLILPELQYSQSACYRSFGPEGRMRDLKGKDWEGGYAFKPFKIKTTRREFKYSRRQPITTGEKIVSSNISASYIYDSRSNSGVVESLIGGTLQGRKKSDIRGASRVCKRSTWKLALEVATLIAIPRVHTALGLASYGEVKDGELLGLRRRVKREVRDTALRDWIRNMGDEDFDCTGVKS
jgi:tRNA-specific adenosine deaminase 1